MSEDRPFICECLKEAFEKFSRKPLRELTPEEYEAKVAAGKKIKLAEGGEH
jgi:hypothetical protein